jgi:inner membrane protein
MDSLTHIALGSLVGEVMLGRQLHRRAWVLGAGANSFPDIDFVASFFLSPADNVLAHRGFTHSILCNVLLVFLFSKLALRWDKQRRVAPGRWIAFFAVQLSLHLLVDAFNAYGLGLFIPFSSVRFSFNTLFVFDPIFFLILAVPVVLVVMNSEPNNRSIIARAGLLVSVLYLGYGWVNKYMVESNVQAQLSRQNVMYHRHFTSPTPLNTWLWYVVAEADSGYYVGYRSVFDRTDSLPLTFFARNEKLLGHMKNDHAVRQLKKFSRGYYTIEKRSDTLVFNDLRFGQIAGWQNPRAPFIFHYFLNFPDANLLVMQRGRFASWNREALRTFTDRIRGR